MSYSTKNEDENQILSQRGIAFGLQSAKSNLLFLDRYHELLRPGGEILIVIDDTVLNGKTQINVRRWILDRFILLGVHSLPFNAFFKAQANIKTSILHLRKRQSENEGQCHVFMSIANNIGHDNHSKDSPERNCLVDILMSYFEWQRTGGLEESVRHNQDRYETLECPQQVWLLPTDKIISERLDAFFYAPELGHIRTELRKREQKRDIKIHYGKEFKRAPRIDRETRKILSESQEILKYIEIGDVTPYGLIVRHIEGKIDDLPSRGQFRIKTGDVLVAINNSSRGTVVLVPKDYDGAVCTSGFIVLRPDSIDEGKLLWYALRSEYCRSQIYYLAQTASQSELKDDVWENDFMIPLPLDALRTQALSEVDGLMQHILALTEAGVIKLGRQP